MHAVSGVLLEDAERGALEDVRPFIGIAAPSDEARQEWERRWGGVCNRDVISYEGLARAAGYARATRDACVLEATMAHWEEMYAREHPGDEAQRFFPLQMAKYLTEIRADMARQLDAALQVLAAALELATPRPVDEEEW